MKDDIKKIDEQIKNILDTEENNSPNTDNNPVVQASGDTKRLDTISDMDEIELLVEEDKPKEQETVPEINVEEKAEEPTPNSSNNDSSGKKSIILIAALCTIVLTIGIVTALLLSNKNNKNNTSGNISLAEKEKILERYGNAIEEVISITYMKKNIAITYEEATKMVYFKNDIACDIHEIYDDGSLYLNDCTIDNEEVDFSYGKKQQKKDSTVPAGNVLIYVLKGSGEATLEVPRNGTNYVTYSIDIKEKYYDLELLNSKNSDYIRYVTEKDHKSHLINYKTGEKALKNVTYSSIAPISNGTEYDIRYVAVSKNNNGHEEWGFYDIIDSREVVKPQFMFTSWGYTPGPTTIVYSKEDKVAVNRRTWKSATEYDENSVRYGIIDYKSGTFSVPIEYTSMWNIDNYLFCINSAKKSFIFDYLGNRYLEGQYDKVLDVLSFKYILIQDEKDVKLVNISGKSLYNYGEYSPQEIYKSYKDEHGPIFIQKIEKTEEEKPTDETNTVPTETTQESNSNEQSKDKTKEKSEVDYCIKFLYYEDSKTGKVEEGPCSDFS